MIDITTNVYSRLFWRWSLSPLLSYCPRSIDHRIECDAQWYSVGWGHQQVCTWRGVANTPPEMREGSSGSVFDPTPTSSTANETTGRSYIPPDAVCKVAHRVCPSEAWCVAIIRPFSQQFLCSFGSTITTMSPTAIGLTGANHLVRRVIVGM